MSGHNLYNQYAGNRHAGSSGHVVKVLVHLMWKKRSCLFCVFTWNSATKIDHWKTKMVVPQWRALVQIYYIDLKNVDNGIDLNFSMFYQLCQLSSRSGRVFWYHVVTLTFVLKKTSLLMLYWIQTSHKSIKPNYDL